jgi:sialate O-acetylesterase
MKASLLLAAAAVLSAGQARAEVAMPAFFSDHAVLQRDKPLPIWGTAAPGEAVEVSLGSQKAATKAGPDGRWIVKLPAQPLCKEPLTLTAKGSNTLTRTDILLGDVWLCSGQSNMSIGVGHFFAIPEYKDDLKASALPQVRHFGVVENFATEEQSDVQGKWLVSGPGVVAQFTAVGYYFARKVHAETGVPIGIVRAAKGSTTIEMWMSQESIYATPEMAPYAKQMRDALGAWEEAKKVAVAAGKLPEAEDFPQHPFGEKVRTPRCVTLNNGMITPLAPMALRGILWYQGESNSNAGSLPMYPAAMRSLIESWRKAFADASLPFLFVQLPNYQAVSEDPGKLEPWALMREAQAKCLAIPNTRMAVTLDIGQAEDIHPTNKYDVGERLAALALHHDYKMAAVVASGPVFKAMAIKGNRAQLSFTELGGGLMAGHKEGRAPVVAQADGKLQRFAIAGADHKWVWADAVIEGDTVVVSSAQVPAPVAVRYGFTANPAGANLYNKAGLPAAPFRTDTANK